MFYYMGKELFKCVVVIVIVAVVVVVVVVCSPRSFIYYLIVSTFTITLPIFLLLLKLVEMLGGNLYLVYKIPK